MRKQKEDFNAPMISPFEMIIAEARLILLYGEIDNCSAREINTQLQGMSIKNYKKEIYLEINSPGGSVSDGIAILNTIQLIPSPVITIINGEAASMAGIISVVGDHRIITPNSYWLGHPLQDLVGGTAQTIKDRGDYLIKLENNLKETFERKTKLTNKEFEQMLRGELWLNSKECLEKGIVDEIQYYPEPRPIKNKKNKRKK